MTDEVKVPDKALEYVSEFGYCFKSPIHEVCFVLAVMDGESRANILGITKELYSSRLASKKWHSKWAQLIHPDRLKDHPDLTEISKAASSKLNELYARMKKNGK